MTIEGEEHFGARLRRLREDQEMHVPDLARRVGLTEAAIRQLESGRAKEPRLSEGVRLADALGVGVHHLAFGEGENRIAELERRMAAVEDVLAIASD